jgi:hypothetical protein
MKGYATPSFFPLRQQRRFMEARRDELELARVCFDVADREQADQPRANSQNIGLHPGLACS